VNTHQTDLAAPLPVAPEPDFEVLGARTVRHAASPMLMIDLHVSEPSGRRVYMIALTIQVMIEPARRTYDAPTRERLEGLFGPPERWSVTTRSLVWSQLDVVVPAFTGSTTIAVPIACNYDMEVAASKYLHSLPDGEAPLAMHFNGVVYYPNDGADPLVAVGRFPHAGIGLDGDDRALLPEHRLGGAPLPDARPAGAAAGRSRPRHLRRHRAGAAG
jgi:hypothetical protein